MKTLAKPALLAALVTLIGCPSAEPAAFHASKDIAPTDSLDFLASAPLDIDAITESLEPTPPLSLLDQEAVPHHDPKFHDHLEEAVMLQEEARNGDAIDALRLALFDAPGSATVWMNLGLAYDGVGRGSRAESCVREALRHEPRLADGHRFLARRLLDANEPAAARPYAQKLVGFARGDAEAEHLLGRTYVALSMWDEAITQNRRAVAADPQNVYAYNNLGFAALQIGRTQLALQYLEAALELDGVEPYMLNNLGVAYERVGRDSDALTVYARAADLDPGYVKARANRDRVRGVVDARVADEVSRILADQARSRRGTSPAPQAALFTKPGNSNATDRVE